MHPIDRWYEARAEFAVSMQQQKSGGDIRTWADIVKSSMRFSCIDDFTDYLDGVQEILSQDVERWLQQGYGENDYLVNGFRHTIAAKREAITYLYCQYGSLFCHKFPVPEFVEMQ